MLYKVTPMMTPAPSKKVARDPLAPKEARKRRKSAVYDHEGHEVLITMMCLKCKSMKPLTMFGLRKMADGAIRNQPWCRTCRSGASSARKKEQRENEPLESTEAGHTHAAETALDGVVQVQPGSYVNAPSAPLAASPSEVTVGDSAASPTREVSVAAAQEPATT